MSKFPLVSVEVGETMAVHVAVILWFGIDRAAGFDGLSHHVIDFLAAGSVQCDQHFGVGMGIADFFLGVLCEPGFLQQHGEDVFADHHAQGIRTAEARVEGEAELCEEFSGGFYVADGQVDEDPGGHSFLIFIHMNFVKKTRVRNRIIFTAESPDRWRGIGHRLNERAGRGMGFPLL